MDTSLSWIKAYVPDLDVTAQEYTDAMTLTGTKVEGFEELDADLDKIVVGQIEKIEKHPDADKLVVCQVNIGAEVIQIVTGAKNVFEGAKVPVVLDGGRVAGGHEPGQRVAGGIKIKKGKLRGVPSYGMMCSIEELGSTKEMYPEQPENGIYIFPEDTEVGADAVELLGLHDVVFEYEITSNRVDCYSVVGIAREAAATFNKEFKPPVVTETGNDEDVNDYVKVTVENTDLCSRYCARAVKNIKIGPSPKWLQRRLSSVGIRPINNLVDITNYVMEEYGQPMHAYDLDTLAGHQIVVKNAQDGEKFVTLDGQERTMDKDVLMICDGEKAVGIAGIMGGENSMITDNAKTMLFEAACFDGVNIRKSSKRVGLRTDASGKFEKGLDPNNAMDALNRACQLVEELGAGEVVGGAIDVYSKKKESVRVPFDAEKINRMLGTNISEEDMLGYFKKIDLDYDADTKEVIAQPLLVNGKTYDVTCVSMGNPHAIVYLDKNVDLKAFELEKIGPMFENHPAFPDRVNTEFIQVCDSENLNMRVWERGSGETFACGTGACASLVATVLNGLCNDTATLHLLGGDLKITWDKKENTVYMEGPAETVFTGEWLLKEEN